MTVTALARDRVDPRGARFAAAVTSAVLAAVLLTGSALLLAAQVVVFAIAVVFGAGRAPYAVLFRRAIRPRLGPPTALEAGAPVRFAQGVGLAFGAVGTVGYLSGATALGVTATAAALFAAFLNAAFGICLGCETYLLIQRSRTRLSLSRTKERKEVVA
jgi:Domain of unknown function (DUF4395)